MKTINLKNIKEIDGKSCKIVYNTGAGCYEVVAWQELVPPKDGE